MVRMVDLVKGEGDKEPDPEKKKKPASPKGGGKSSGSPEEERPAKIDLPEPEKGAGEGISFGAAVASTGAGASAKDRRSFPGESGKKTSAGGSLRSPTSLDAKSKYCPFLGGRKNREKIISYPVLTNVCYAEGSQEKKLLRTLTFPFSVIPAQRQREFCLATYARCPVYQAKQKEESG